MDGLRNERRKRSFIPLICGEQCTRIWADDTLYAFQEGRTTGIITENGSYFLNKKLSEISRFLGSEFFFVTSRCAVNFDRVESIRCRKVVFDNGRELELGRDSYYECKKAFAAYLLSTFEKETEIIENLETTEKP